ncbi:AMP-binding protein [Yaniella flava]|uniref:AMP-binding protein n=1 Tax=Yaniella flava TaxID=287930 RepID=A0ABN2U9J0_9MICC
MEQRKIDEAWDQVAEHLVQDPDEDFNTYVDVCGKWANDRSKLAMILRNADGTKEFWTYHQLSMEVAKASTMFKEAGLKRGDRVAGMLSRQIETWITALAAWKTGLVYVPLFVGFGSDAISERLEDSGSKAIVVGHQWRDTLGDAKQQLSNGISIFTVAGPRGIGLRQGDVSYWAELERCNPDFSIANTNRDTPATLMYTSGTTSTPKACIIPHSGFVALMPYTLSVFGVDKTDILFATSDPGWSYGLYTTGVTPMALGVTRIIYTGDFDPKAWVQLMKEEQATFISSAPSAYRRLLATATRSGLPQSLRGANSAGEPLDEETANRWRELTGSPLRDGYGLTELGMVLGDLVKTDDDEPGALSAPIPGFHVKLVNTEGHEVKNGPGQLAIQKPRFQLSIGYDNVPETWDSRWEEGYYITDDLLERTENGGWRFLGRADDIIVTSGYNVGPAEVEAVLLEDPGVDEAAVVAEPDPSRGQIVRAVLVKASDATPESDLIKRLQNAVRDRIGRHAYPRIVEFLDELPRTATGKLRRASLKSIEASKTAT